ncbi:dihydroorotate dehydrogenase electron transfer subunit [Chryseomicrobium sp. FSL W7-1435]|uniref:dihydroorotate dehydrogenase electron transfer subunit n=1 Tax=Chryseomicrobium sp. FSL W7-1435 TaxID=2921704 RepID=UPI00315AFA04
MIRTGLMEIVRHKEIADRVFEMTVIGQQTTAMQQPGQFVHIRIAEHSEPLLRRPISICSIEQETLEFTMIYRVDGRGTQLLSQKRPGDSIDVMGPLGNGFPVVASPEVHAFLIGGGIGVPPLYELAKRLAESGVKMTIILGFQSKKDVFYEEQFKEFGDTFITTVDGSHGLPGYVTDQLALLQEVPSIYYSCGPHAMLHAVEAALPNIPGFLSYEQRMGCGIGACFACVCPTTKGNGDYVKVCSDGPVFQAGVIA